MTPEERRREDEEVRSHRRIGSPRHVSNGAAGPPRSRFLSQMLTAELFLITLLQIVPYHRAGGFYLRFNLACGPQT